MARKIRKMRVIVNGIHFYSTDKAVLQGVGDFQPVNIAVGTALGALERSVEDNKACVGLTGKWNGYDVQLDYL